MHCGARVCACERFAVHACYFVKNGCEYERLCVCAGNIQGQHKCTFRRTQFEMFCCKKLSICFMWSIVLTEFDLHLFLSEAFVFQCVFLSCEIISNHLGWVCAMKRNSK